MENEFKTPEQKEKEKKQKLLQDLRFIIREPSFKMWLRDLICKEIKRQNEKYN